MLGLGIYAGGYTKGSGICSFCTGNFSLLVIFFWYRYFKLVRIPISYDNCALQLKIYRTREREHRFHRTHLQRRKSRFYNIIIKKLHLNFIAGLTELYQPGVMTIFPSILQFCPKIYYTYIKWVTVCVTHPTVSSIVSELDYVKYLIGFRSCWGNLYLKKKHLEIIAVSGNEWEQNLVQNTSSCCRGFLYW